MTASFGSARPASANRLLEPPAPEVGERVGLVDGDQAEAGMPESDEHLRRGGERGMAVGIERGESRRLGQDAAVRDKREAAAE